MSEGPEVKIIAEKLFNASVSGSNKAEIQSIMFNRIEEKIKEKIIGSTIEYVKTYGKNIVIKFSSGVYLRNHMMMWGKWRIYDRESYDKGLAIPPLRSKYGNTFKKNVSEQRKIMDVRHDSRVRLVIVMQNKVLVQFNGPIIQFTLNNPQENEPIKSLGPDGLSDNFSIDKVYTLLKAKSNKNKDTVISNALLDQQIICGIGNKYKSEILFLNNIYPFKTIDSLTNTIIKNIISDIPRILYHGYRNNGKTRTPLNNEKATWDTTHWVFRRSGKPCWVCGTKITSEKKITTRQTFWCPSCQHS